MALHTRVSDLSGLNVTFNSTIQDLSGEMVRLKEEIAYKMKQLIPFTNYTNQQRLNNEYNTGYNPAKPTTDLSGNIQKWYVKLLDSNRPALIAFPQGERERYSLINSKAGF